MYTWQCSAFIHSHFQMQGMFATDCDGSVSHGKWQESTGTLLAALTVYNYKRLVRKKSYPIAQQMAIQLLLRLCSACPQDVPLPFCPCATHYSTPAEWPIPPSQRCVGGQTLPDRNVHWDGRRWVATYAHARPPSSGCKKREAAPHPHPTDPPSGRGVGFLTTAHCIISYGHWKLQLKETMPTWCPSRAVLFDPFHACPEGHILRHTVEDACMNATVWMLCFPRDVELWRD